MVTDFYKILWKSYKIIFLVKLLVLFSNNETEKFENWYGQCFEPMTPPPISPEELLPSLLVYRYFSFLVLLWEYSIIIFLNKLNISNGASEHKSTQPEVCQESLLLYITFKFSSPEPNVTMWKRKLYQTTKLDCN